MSFFPGIMDESVLNHFKLEPNSWHRKNMVPALEQLLIVGNICSHEDLGMQITDLKTSFPFAPSTFLWFFFKIQRSKTCSDNEKKKVDLSLNLHHMKYDCPSCYEIFNDTIELLIILRRIKSKAVLFRVYPIIDLLNFELSHILLLFECIYESSHSFLL